MIDYVTLKITWWALIGFLLTAFTLTGGIEIGVNFLLPFIGHDDNERRLILNSTSPTCAANHAWLITLAGALFTIWPIFYATLFYGMYVPFILLLFMLILRPSGFDYRAKINSHNWRKVWDICLFSGSMILAISFGVVIGNLFTGLPFYFDRNLHEFYTGDFFSMLPPSSLIFGIVNLCMMGIQGALFLQYKLGDKLAERAKLAVKILGGGFFVSAILAGIYVCLWIPGYKIVSISDLNTLLVVTNKKVISVPSGWAANYANKHILWIFPILALLATRVAIHLSSIDRPLRALLTNSIGITCSILTVGCALFPFILPSNLQPNYSLTIWDICSSKFTLEWSLIAFIFIVPIMLLYTTSVYRVMRRGC